MAAVAVVIASVAIGATFVSNLQTSTATTTSTRPTATISSTTAASSIVSSTQQIEQTTQTVTLTRSSPSPTTSYTIEIWTNNTQAVADISNITIVQGSSSPRTQTIQFYVSTPSFVFARPSFQIQPNSNGSLFTFTNTKSNNLPETLNAAQNVLITQEAVQGWIQIQSAPL